MRKQIKRNVVFTGISIFIAMVLFLPGLASADGMKNRKCKQVITMLDEIYDIVSDTNSKLEPCEPEATVGVPKTGQTQSFLAGDDGNLQIGVSWPNPRFTDNVNGTVTDNLTRLIWQKNANCFGGKDWYQAIGDCNGLEDGSCGLTDGSNAGDWRLPNIKELVSLMHYGVFDPALPDTAGTGQWSEADPFTNLQVGYYYYSSTSYGFGSSHAWTMGMTNGHMNYRPKNMPTYLWCVRGEQ